MASGAMSLNCRVDAQRDIWAVTVSFAGGIGLDADTGRSLGFDLDVFWVLEGKKRHEVGMMDDESFRGAFDQIALGGVSGDDVADRVRNAALEGECDPGKRVAQRLSTLALAALAIGTDFVFQQLADSG